MIKNVISNIIFSQVSLCCTLCSTTLTCPLTSVFLLQQILFVTLDLAFSSCVWSSLYSSQYHLLLFPSFSFVIWSSAAVNSFILWSPASLLSPWPCYSSEDSSLVSGFWFFVSQLLEIPLFSDPQLQYYPIDHVLQWRILPWPLFLSMEWFLCSLDLGFSPLPCDTFFSWPFSLMTYFVFYIYFLLSDYFFLSLFIAGLRTYFSFHL